MHKNQLLTALLLFAALCASGQQAILKKILGPEDIQYLNKEAASCYSFTADVQLSFNSNNLYSSKNIKPDKPARLESVIELEKQLKGDNSDAETYAAIAGIYTRLKMKEQAEVNRQRSVNLYRAILEAHPDSVGSMLALAGVFMSGSRFDESKELLRKVMAIRPDDQTPSIMMPMLFMFGGQFDSIYPFVKERVELHPDKQSSYIPLTIYYFYNMYLNMSQVPNAQIPLLKTDSVMDMELLRAYYERDKNNFEREYLYNISYAVTFCTFEFFKAVANEKFDQKNIRFNIEGDDRKKLLELAKTFEGYTTGKQPADKYLPLRMLGAMYILLDEPREAIPHIRKAIAAKPMSKSQLTNNASEDYDNLNACYFILKDSASCEKILLDKIEIAPAIDPLPKDYARMAEYYMSKKKNDLAEKYYKDALKLDPENTQAILGMATLRIVENEHTEANELINRAYKIDKNIMEIYCLSGIIALKDKDVKNAYEFFKLAKKLSETDWIDKELIDVYFETK